ncbi:MAG: winged helix-turn-helix domain-containing protein [Pseudomonadota bacterium]
MLAYASETKKLAVTPIWATGLDSTPQRYAFGSALVDTDSRQLWIEDQAVEVQPKVFDLIEYLIRHRDRVVTKDELFDSVWPNVVVTEATLSQTVKRARDLFRDRGFEGHVIRTVPRHGFQFVHPLSTPAPPKVLLAPKQPAVPFAPKTWYAIIMMLAVAVGLLYALNRDGSPKTDLRANDANSLAVLPFESLIPDQDLSYLADGLTETIINNLSQLPGLRLISYASSYAAAADHGDRRILASELKVEKLLVGSVQLHEGELRISASLLKGEDGSRIWSHQYTRVLDDVFAIQDEISRAVVAQLASELDQTFDLRASGASAESAFTSRAYRLVLRARHARRNGSKASLQEAEQLFREAHEVSPGYADALVGLADVLQVQAVLGQSKREPAMSEALALLAKAIQLEPENAAAFALRAELEHRHLWNFPAARASFARAVALSPASSEVRARFSRFLAKSGDHPQAAEHAWVAADLDPRSINTLSNLAIRMLRENRPADARTAIDEIRFLEPDRVSLPWLEAQWHLQVGNPRDALEWIAQEELAYLRLSISAIALHQLGRTQQAEQTLQTLIATDEGAAFQIAEAYAQMGQASESFYWLEQALRAGDPGLSELYSSPYLEKLYTDPRFNDVAQTVGLPKLAN